MYACAAVSAGRNSCFKSDDTEEICRPMTVKVS